MEAERGKVLKFEYGGLAHIGALSLPGPVMSTVLELINIVDA